MNFVQNRTKLKNKKHRITSYNVCYTKLLRLFHENGKLQAIGRTRNRALFSTWSEDNGKTWSDVVLLDMPNNNSGTDAVTMKNDEHVLIYNHVLPDGDDVKGVRTPLNLAVSKDGINWDSYNFV